jgi:hypothetical protein
MSDPTAPVRLTSGRRRALEILALVHPKPARLSIRSMLDADGGGIIVSQPAHHLADLGLVDIELYRRYPDDPPERQASLTPAGIALAQAEGMPFSPVEVEEVSEGLKELARDLYRAMNESVTDHLTRLPADQRMILFTCAHDQVEQDLDAGRTPDVLRAFTEALLLIDLAYSLNDPNA